jgi:hypothetical protein
VYPVIVLVLMLILPIASSLLEVFLGNHGVFALGVFLKWFVFWPVGVRLLLAGFRQIFQPRYTAETVLGIKSPDALIVVRELGFGNLAIGSVGALSLAAPDWIVPAGFAGAIFYALAGINHALHKPRNRNQNIAMLSDLSIALLLGVLLLPI